MTKRPLIITEIKSPSAKKKPVKKIAAPPAVKAPAPPELVKTNSLPVVPEHPKITTTGFVDGLSDEFYHGDCCDTPSISSSMVKAIDEECAAKMRSESYLDPDREEKENPNFDFGHALHKIFLEPDLFKAAIAEIEFDDYKKDEPKRQRMLAYEAGKIPLLTKHLRTVYRMQLALMDHPVACKAFTNGIGERSYFAKDPETGVWLKARVDWDMFKPRIICDYKGMASSNPKAFSKAIHNYGYYIQEPFYKEVVRLATGEEVDECYFIVQEKEYPFLVSVIEIKPAAIEWGQKIMRRSIREFADCLDKNEWPGYRDPERPNVDGVITVDLPTSAYYELEERQLRGDFE